MSTTKHSSTAEAEPHTKHSATAEMEPPILTRPAPPEREREVPPSPTQFIAPNTIGDLLDPDAVLGTRFSGPVISGNSDDGVPGIALLHKRAKITFAANGPFSIPVHFPASAILTQLVVQIQQSFNGTLSKLNLGSAINGVDIASVDLTVAPTQVFNNITSILGSTWTIYLSLVPGAGATQGKCTALIFYSVPAMVVPN